MTQSLTKPDILHLAKLAKLTLSEAEIKKYQQQLSETLDYVKNLEEITPSYVEKNADTRSLQETKNVFFEDKTADERRLTQEEALANTKSKNDHYFIVERIL